MSLGITGPQRRFLQFHGLHVRPLMAIFGKITSIHDDPLGLPVHTKPCRIASNSNRLFPLPGLFGNRLQLVANSQWDASEEPPIKDTWLWWLAFFGPLGPRFVAQHSCITEVIKCHQSVESVAIHRFIKSFSVLQSQLRYRRRFARPRQVDADAAEKKAKSILRGRILYDLYVYVYVYYIYIHVSLHTVPQILHDFTSYKSLVSGPVLSQSASVLYVFWVFGRHKPIQMATRTARESAPLNRGESEHYWNRRYNYCYRQHSSCVDIVIICISNLY